MRELEEDEKTARRSLDLAKKNLQVGQDELARIGELFGKKLIARSTLDAEEQKVIQLRQQVEELQGQINTFASRRVSIDAQIMRAQEQVKGQETTLGRTEIKMPIDARIGEVSIEKDEFVSVGAVLFEALGLESVEINAQLPILHMGRLVSAIEGQKLNIDAANIQNILETLQLKARVRLVGGRSEAFWEGRVVRLSESIDPARRTLGIVVSVDDPYKKVIAGKRPPLMKGMYTSVELYAPKRDVLVIPRKALHQGRVYLVNEQNRLEIRPVEIQMFQGDIVVVGAGLMEGERLIISDLVPVIHGMPLSPQEASDVEAKLKEQSVFGIETQTELSAEADQ
jgi:multidrug efflux pump subunit AcrA (membrane-fusion protein)